ncbi:hypothetical protein [Streptomyces ipomoeae]|uniref:hypothetical protein n=1 Tax=Streptomyces ipomoeae TaxID=103232 RepID=UPI0029AAF6A7|nr:hypothetical protein [Streptomyces ipomoeae]MDX2700787.1 hypothetical protein [Streptomyces ipomoeae]MDX2845409.1 hypothetical protein [Streptomyces ipomoeae]
MIAVAGGLLALACIAVVGVALGVAVAAWGDRTPAWGSRIAYGAVVTVGTTALLLATVRPIAALLH